MAARRSLMRRRLFPIFLVAVAVLAAPAQYRDQTWEQRDEWQHPAAVLDALHLHAGSTVADIGAGPGYFTFRMAERVGPQGKVYAVDLDVVTLRDLKKKLADAGLKQ